MTYDPTRNRTVGRARAGRRSSALPSGMDGGHGLHPEGLLVRGVVLATYVTDEGAYEPEVAPNRQVAVYCDVLVYAAMEGYRGGPIRRALVSQPISGMHEGLVWKPRAARRDFAQGDITPSSDPRDLDGDHVLIAFMENSFTNPVIIRSVPHPRLGQGNDALGEAGHRQKLVLADGEPALWKHRGSFYGTDEDGNFVVDTTRAHGGDYGDDGAETPADDADHGTVHYKVAHNAKFVVEGLDPDGANPKFFLEVVDDQVTLRLRDGESLQVIGKDGATTMQVGDGAVPVAIADPYLRQQLENIISTFNSHTHTVPDAVCEVSGGSGDPAVGTNTPGTAEAPATPMDPYDADIASGKVSIPDND